MRKLISLPLSPLVLLLLAAIAAFAASPAHAQPADILQIETAWSIPQAHAGDQRALAVVLNLKHPYHVNPDPSRTSDPYIPTIVEVTTDAPGITIGPAQYPEPHQVKVNYAGEAGTVPAYEGKVVVYVPVIVDQDAEVGSRTLDVKVSYQACDDTSCYMPGAKTTQATLDVTPISQPIPAAAETANSDLFAGFDSSAFAALQEGVAAEVVPDIVKFAFFGWDFNIDAATGGGLAMLLLIALIAGFFLNFTPCVLPVIPIKVMSLHQQAAHGDRRRTFFLGLVFSLGIIACFVALGSLVAGLVFGLEQLEWGEIFSYWWVSAILGGVIAVMALSMFGLFTFRLPQSAYMFNPSHDTASGNFLLGVLTAVLSTPCTAPLLGAAIAWAARQPSHLALSTFAAMGVGMAAPYLLLTANPKWINHLPRTGPGSELVKQTMGGLLLAVAVFFFGPLIPGGAEWWIIAAVVAATMVWLVLRTWQITGKLALRIGVAFIAIALTASTVLGARTLTGPGPIPWQPFTQEAFLAARERGDIVLLEFTADWCANCKALELTVYREPELAEFFARDGYTAFQVDLTSQNNIDGWTLQRKLGGGGGIPLAAVYRPGGDEPAGIFQGLFTAGELIAVLAHPPAAAGRQAQR